MRKLNHLKKFESFLDAEPKSEILSKLEEEFMNSPFQFTEMVTRDDNSIYIRYKVDWSKPETMDDSWDPEEIIDRHLDNLSNEIGFEYYFDLSSIRIYPQTM